MPSTNGHKKRVALYCRVSTDEQARSGYSLAQQLEALRAYCAREGYEVAGEFKDEGWSGMSLERPGLDELRDCVLSGHVSVVLAQDRDRFARDPVLTGWLRREFEEHGTKLRALNDQGDDSPEGEFMDGVLDQLAKLERAKITERSRRGRMRKAREGKVLASHAPRYGFKFNESRDGYEINEEEMKLVRRIFHMVGAEGRPLRSIKIQYEREGLPTPKGGKRWCRAFFRSCILDDVYKPHSFEEVKAVVSPEVAARLDCEATYGIWWFNRRGLKIKQVSEASANGRRYRKTYRWYHKPTEEWIAVPVPDSGIPLWLVDAARAAIENNGRVSRAGRKFWELTGGILRCKDCGLAMNAHHSTKTKKGRLYAYDYYRCSSRSNHGAEACVNAHKPRANDLEPRVWAFVSNLLSDPEQLRADLERMIELERKSVRGDPDREAKAWLDKLSEVDRKRSKYQEMAAEGLITFSELRSKLAGLEEIRETAEHELDALKSRRERLEQLERDKDALLETYTQMAPEALEALTSEERHQLYKMLQLKVLVSSDGTPEITGAFGGPTESPAPSSAKKESSSMSVRMAGP